MAKLTPKQELFVLEYTKDFNATQASIRAGYSKSSAKAIGTENLSKPVIGEAIAIVMKKRMDTVKLDSDFVLQHLGGMAQADIIDIIDELTGRFKPLKDWPKIWRQMIQGFDVSELFEGKGEDRVKVGEVVKVRFIDRLKNIELFGKHVNVKAFENDGINIFFGDKLVEQLREGRKNAQAAAEATPLKAVNGGKE